MSVLCITHVHIVYTSDTGREGGWREEGGGREDGGTREGGRRVKRQEKREGGREGEGGGSTCT